MLQSVNVGSLGIDGDRILGILDPTTNRLVTRKTAGEAGLKLAALNASLDHEGNLYINNPATQETVGGEIRYGLPDTDDFMIFDDVMRGVGQDPKFNEYLSSVMGKEVQLVGLSSEHERTIDADIGRPDRFTGFSDGAMLSVHSLESQLAVAEYVFEQTGDELTNDQFRSNLVVRGSQRPGDEDYWEKFSVGWARFEVQKAMSRCVMTEQFRDPEAPDIFRQRKRTTQQILRKELGRYGMNRPDSTQKKILFAQSVTVEAGGLINVGDFVEVTYRSMEPNWQPAV